MATMTRKEFVLQVTEALQKNPRAILAGHGIPQAVLKLIASRPDVIAKLAVILWSTKYFKKGAKGLKKALNFKISGYKNFQDFNKRARTDVENFMQGLTPADQSTFNNNESILTLIMLPDNASGEETTDMAYGKSVAIGFDKAVKKEFKIPGGIYVTIMWGDSVIRTVEEKKAVVKAKINSRKQAKRTPAKVKMELTRKAKAKLEKIALENSKLEAKRSKNTLELEQVKSFADHLGVKGTTERDIIGGIKGYSKEMRTLVGKLSGPKKTLFKKAVTLVRAGNNVEAEVLLDKIGVKRITDLVLNRKGVTQISKVQDSRIKAMRVEIKKLSRSNEKLLVDMSLAPTTSLKSSIRQKMKRQIARINELKAKLKVYQKTFTVGGLKNKAKMIAETNKRIEANIAKGLSITNALTSAIAALNATPQEKEEIKDAIMQEVAEGTPVQFAVQTAIQQKVQQAPIQQAPIQQIIQDENNSALIPVMGDIEEVLNEGLSESGYETVGELVIDKLALYNIDGEELMINEDYEEVTIFDYLIMAYSAFATSLENNETSGSYYTESITEADLQDLIADIEEFLLTREYNSINEVLINNIDNYDMDGDNIMTTDEGEEMSIFDFLIKSFEEFGVEDEAFDAGGEEIEIEDMSNGFERDTHDLAGNAYNDYTIDNDPEDRPSEEEIMSYFVTACNEAGVDASEMTAAYDVYNDNVNNYMATSVGSPTSEDDFGGFDSSLVGNSTIDDILNML